MNDNDMAEHERAFHWRKKIMGLSRAKAAELTGFSTSRISDIEQGFSRASGDKINPKVMQRYRLICAAISLGVDFDWSTMTLQPASGIKMAVHPATAPQP